MLRIYEIIDIYADFRELFSERLVGLFVHFRVPIRLGDYYAQNLIALFKPFGMTFL